MKRRLTVALVALSVLAIAWAGRAREGRAAIVDCEGALGRGDGLDAILAARSAAESRCPLCVAPEEGLSRLERMAADAEARGDDATAFAAWRATRAALLATSSFTTTSARRAHAEVEVARLAHRLDAAAVAAGASPTPAAAEDRLRTTLAASDLPTGAAFALIGVGGVAFLMAASRFATRRRSAHGPTDLALAAAGAGLAAVGALLF